MNKCTRKQCPFIGVKSCDMKDCPYRTEYDWIPCSERLPKTNEVVLLCGKYNIFCGYHNTKGEWYSITGDGWETDMDFPDSNKGDILAWKPLPEPYSIESDGIKEEER